MAQRRRLPSGELEHRVLGVLWSTGEPMTPGEVHEVLATDRRLAYTTVMTILTRLCDKGEVTRHKRGRAFAYQPVLGRDERVARRMQEILDAADDHVLALNTFIASLPENQQAALRDALEDEGPTP